MTSTIARLGAVSSFLVLMAGTAVAREYRGPLLVGQHGYDFDAREKGLWYWSASSDWYTRSAHRAFKADHGIATQELSALFFNKESFRLSQIFEDCLVRQNTEHYNPYMRVMTIAPRVEYSESGLCLGGEISRAVFRGKGRFGMRVSVPLRAVETMRKDAGSRRDSQTEDVVRLQKNEVAEKLGFAYRLDFVEAIPTKSFATSQVNYAATSGDSTYVSMFGGAADSAQLAAIYSSEGHTPRGTRVGVAESTVGSSTLPTSIDGLDVDTVYAFGTTGYGGLADTAAPTVTARVANQDKKATVWVTSVHEDIGGALVSGATTKISTDIGDFVTSFNSNTYEWLYDRGYMFESTRQVGLGDTDLSFFYEQVFGDRLTGGVAAVLRVPTACGSGDDEHSYAGNPYKSHLGNGRHVEIGGSLYGDVEMRSWLALHFDGCYRFAIARTEKICATPKGSLIKNIGSEQSAEVSWHSVVCNADAHFCHPQTTDLSGFVGYQLYLKRHDTVRFVTSAVDSWLGRFYNTATHDYSVENAIILDNTLAQANTEQIAHRIKAGFTYHFSDWFSVSAGAGITFAGKNMPKESDAYAACKVVF